MIGWLNLLLLIAAASGLLWLCGLRGGLLQIGAAALLFGAAGYAAQGRPGLEGMPTASVSRPPAIALTRLRHTFFGPFNSGEQWQLIAESRASRGDTAGAVEALRAGIRHQPNDPALWTSLGNALVEHADVITPASDLAYTRAVELAPGYPGPRFFRGLALARSGDAQGAVAEWRRVLAEAPADASWRPLVEDAILAISSPGVAGAKN